MKKTLFLFVLFFLLTVQSAEKPNIIFILVDDQRFDSLSCYGNAIIQTPNIDKLASQGTRFTNVFATTSICAASRATIFTGLYETTHGYTFGKPPLSEKIIDQSYPVLLKKNGYKTGFTGKYGVKIAKEKDKLNESFDIYKPIAPSQYFINMPDGTKRHETDVSCDNAIAMMEEFKEKPFCISISFNATHANDSNHEPGKGHYPWPESANGMYEGVTFPPPMLDTDDYRKTLPKFMTDQETSMNRLRYFWGYDTAEKYQANMQGYARMISGIDNVVGRLNTKLKELGIDKNTVIIYTADNGYYLGNRGFQGKWTHWEESIRIPLIIFDPRNPKTQVIEKITLNVDYPATMLDLAGIPVPTHYQGASLVPFLSGKNPENWRTSYFCEHQMLNQRIPRWEGIRTEQFVYAHYYDHNYEFFHDLKVDPREEKNLIDDPNYLGIIKQLRAEREAKKKLYLESEFLNKTKNVTPEKQSKDKKVKEETAE